MLERCPECSVARESGREKEESDPWVVRPCASCGHGKHGKKAGAGPKFAPRDSMPSFAGARAKLKTATQDLFRLSAGNSIPVEARPAPEPVRASEKPAESIPSSARKPEASIMFSLEELMKANPVSVKQEEAPDQLWSMQAATPLFGTAHDQALLTTPLKNEPSPSMDSMTMPSRTPLARRWLPLGLAIGGACLGVAAAGWWFTGQSQAEPAPQAVGLDAPALATAAAVAPAPPVSVATSAPSSEDQLAADPPTVSPGVSPQPGDAPSDGATDEDAAKAPSSGAVGDEKAKSTKKPKAAPSSTARKAAAFDKGAAKAALSAAAGKAAGCGAGGAPGKGKVLLTFAPSGKVSSASLVDGPFAGKVAGACALKHFRAARVPAFSGSAVTVTKSFSIQ